MKTFSPTELSKVYNIPQQTVSQWVKSAKIPSTHEGEGKARRYKVSEQDFIAFLHTPAAGKHRRKVENNPPQANASASTKVTVSQPAQQLPKWEERPFLVDQLQSLPDFQMRTTMNPQAISEYTESIRMGDSFPRIQVVMVNASAIVVDGHHRVEAYRRAGRREIEAHVILGDRKMALRYALQANRNHGLRRTTKDKQRAVHIALETYPDWTNVAIAELCGVSEGSVRNHREARGKQLKIHVKNTRKVAPYRRAKSAITRCRCTAEDAVKLIKWLRTHYQIES